MAAWNQDSFPESIDADLSLATDVLFVAVGLSEAPVAALRGVDALTAQSAQDLAALFAVAMVGGALVESARGSAVREIELGNP